MPGLDWLKDYQPRLARFAESEISHPEGSVVGWQVSALDDQGLPLSSGCHEEQDIARQIAIAELLERATVSRINRSMQDDDVKLRARLLLPEFPSSSGFAAGFTNASTRTRAICEAIERWAWSKWIDHGHKLPEVTSSIHSGHLRPIAQTFASSFDSVRFFQLPLQAELPRSPEKSSFSLQVALGFKGDGIFPGSRVIASASDTEKENAWTHALTEAWRHLQIHRLGTSPLRDVIQHRVVYFAHHATHALSQIDAARNESWPTARFRLIARIPLDTERFFLWRAICKDFKGWHEGDETRFVY